VVSDEFETSIEIFAHVLSQFGIPENIVEQQVTLIRSAGYAMLRGRASDRAVRAEWLRALEAAVTQTYMLGDASPARGRTLRELDLRARSGATIVAVTRAGKPIASPPPDLVLEPGDVLVLVGAHGQIAQAKALLSG
jgi:CPA2 family monovalent cation:H+ antiporter-2